MCVVLMRLLTSAEYLYRVTNYIETCGRALSCNYNFILMSRKKKVKELMCSIISDQSEHEKRN